MKSIKVITLITALVFSVLLIGNSCLFAAGECFQILLKDGAVTLQPPFEITSAGLYKDGGTIAIVVEDGKGVSLPLCLDGRIKVPQDQRYIYVGATYPTNAKAKQVPMGSTTEKDILKILKSAKYRESRMVRGDLIQSVIERLSSR